MSGAELVRSETAVAHSAPVEMSLESFAMQMATNPSFDADKMVVVMRELRESQAQTRREKFETALAACQKEMPRVQQNGLIDPKGAKIPYAKLEDLDACIRPIYEGYGFGVGFDAPMTSDGKIRVTANFSCAGHTEKREITASPDGGSSRLPRSPMQAVKATITAGRRHLLEMFFNIITVGADDPVKEETITQDQADSIRQRMNDLPQQRPGFILSKLCEKYGVKKPEELLQSQHADALKDVENTEKAKAVKQ